MKRADNLYDLVVVGGGHAGTEAAFIAAKLGLSVALVSLDPLAVARMSCNPAIGGLAKGQIVREIDVLGGLMGRVADQTGIQFKILNRSKGKSVWSPRAQVDKKKYEAHTQASLTKQSLITLIQGEVTDVIDDRNSVSGVRLRSGQKINSRAVILTCGTFLNGLIHIGERKVRAGRMGEPEAEGLSTALVARGLKSGRLKTGTPPRLMKNSVDWNQTEIMLGDEKPTPFSYQTRNFNPPNIPCHQVKTNAACHDIIRQNLNRSPMFSGDVFGIGPRYCPSIEDKINRFSHHSAHVLFLEPEWLNADQIYTNGFSTSLPEEVQLSALRQIPGLKKVRFLRPGYAIEYDYFPPAQHRATLESKLLSGLFFAGQINGTSGYEEAAAQGLIAGINAVKYVRSEAPLTLNRNEAYIGVLIDDLITKDTFEPYRMFTSRAEYRLLLRYSNSDRRLVDIAKKHALIDNQLHEQLLSKLETTDAIVRLLEQTVAPEEINAVLNAAGETPVRQKQPARQLLKRPEVTIRNLPDRLFDSIKTNQYEPYIVDEIFSEAETTIKYEGYIERHHDHINKMKAQEKYLLPKDMDYSTIASLSSEAREKLQFIKPETLGQAMRISGVSPADISVLAVMLVRKS